jgi:hypothetical protein
MAYEFVEGRFGHLVDSLVAATYPVEFRRPESRQTLLVYCPRCQRDIEFSVWSARGMRWCKVACGACIGCFLLCVLAYFKLVGPGRPYLLLGLKFIGFFSLLGAYLVSQMLTKNRGVYPKYGNHFIWVDQCKTITADTRPLNRAAVRAVYKASS